MFSGIIYFLVVSFLVFLIAKEASVVVMTIAFSICLGLYFCFASHALVQSSLMLLSFSLLLLASIPPLRRALVSRHILKLYSRLMPKMSDTEREALEAGTVGFEGELFSGSPNLGILQSQPFTKLTFEEQAFLDGPTNVLCRMLDDWDVTHVRQDLPPEAWDHIKAEKFLGMIIPKIYGGLEFSATAVMSVLVKLYGRSITAATTVAVPNSLGPAELLLKYGTEEQKTYYLPRLASGVEIPCFALTGKDAGSDAASITDSGIVTYEEINGENVLGIRLSWNKRYITLCPVATVIGLAFKLYDPENLLGKGHDIGISCALIPATTPGVIKGRRHFPLNIAFMNGPTQGHNVFVPIDCLIGGAHMAGKGWKMLMECLSAGRAISLPSSASGGAQVGALVSGAYARVRRQFNQAIANFEGIEEPLARIAANTYIIDAALTMAATEIDQGAKPAVAGAILKYHTTERARQVAIDAMDIHGGKGICLGPSNYIARSYQGTPICITVEGANILSRSLIIFGQGAIRCHPYLFDEMQGVSQNDLNRFDKAFWGHFGFILSNFIQSFVLSVTDGRWCKAPASNVSRYYRSILRYSRHLAFLADFSMILIGSELKRKEKLSARLGDMLSNLYLLSAVLKRYSQDGEPSSDLPLVEWCCQDLLHACESALRGVVANFPSRFCRGLLRLVLLPFGSKRYKPSDVLGHQVAVLVSTPNETRQRLIRLAFCEVLDNCPVGRLEQAFHLIVGVEALEKKVLQAVKKGMLISQGYFKQIDEAEALNLITTAEAQRLRVAEQARQMVIAVDDFSSEELQHQSMIRAAHKVPQDGLAMS